MSFFVAFYSYKGGVGRTLALANVAWSLARKRRVVLLDMDLEAPSLHEFPEFALSGKGRRPGFLDYAAAYRKTGRCPSIRDFVHRCEGKGEERGRGELWLMPAGQQGRPYQENLGTLPWRRLHEEQGTEPFLEGLRQALSEEIQPDYVLIDARTGLSDIGGLSTHRLADMVVLVFNLTRACLNGTLGVYKSFMAVESRVTSIQLVASLVPSLALDKGSVIEGRLKFADEAMPNYGRPVIRLDYDPGMALAEELAVAAPERFPAAQEYENLREAIQRAHSGEVLWVLERAEELRSDGRLEEALGELRSFTTRHPDNPEGHLALGDVLLEAGRAEEASEAFRAACDRAPQEALTYRRLGVALVAAGDAGGAVAALEMAETLGEGKATTEESAELYGALTRAHVVLDHPKEEFEARRRALLALADDPEVGSVPHHGLRALRSEFLEVLGRRPPYDGFSAEAAWSHLVGSVALSPAEKLAIARRLLAGRIDATAIALLLETLDEERVRLVELTGPHAGEFLERMVDTPVEVRGPSAFLALRRGDETDGAVVLLAALIGDLPPEGRSSLLAKAEAVMPKNPKIATWRARLAPEAHVEVVP